ncbi:NUDIX domain-containing protein [uncultured Ilumatobacter sp.]|jgi:putative (di)nucleoside polyphosphate hydrolase|uniref:NUDIX domain-containing protein n=1 Tax=Ilumatobacter sp. TaxID=1967498 RepID=UPI0030956D8C|tara:strand:- start:43 stop:480 length:438 start_codon:yes stop_codon:yes gene_type:complete
MGSLHFRAGTVAVVRDSHGRVLAFERSDRRGQWQLPQGGIDAGESPVEGVWRELREETGLTADEVHLVDEYPEWTAYEWPEGVKQRGQRLGQAQRWFFFQINDDRTAPTADGVEFVDWKWVEVDWLIEQVVDFRLASYQRVLGSL